LITAPLPLVAAESPLVAAGVFILQHLILEEAIRSLPMDKVNIAEKLAQFDEQWSPKVVGQVNDCHVKLTKLEGEFVWHHHEQEDELFLVVSGSLLIKFRDRDIRLEEGEFLIVPRGVEHKPVAEEEVHVLLVEPASTLNTGNVRSERTLEDLERL
jgi:mannose-6-phosphate isomerase-like protein (cupin superfamily)